MNLQDLQPMINRENKNLVTEYNPFLVYHYVIVGVVFFTVQMSVKRDEAAGKTDQRCWSEEWAVL